MALNDITMTHSGILTDKASGKNYVLVRFERAPEKKTKKVIIGEGRIKEKEVTVNDEIEIKIPSGEVVRNKGFSNEETGDLKRYLKEHEEEIKEKAKSISSFLHIFR